MTIEIIYNAGKVQRFHANPHIAPFAQTDADHTWGVVALLFLLNPGASRNLIAHAVFHDIPGERFAGDLPHPVKVANPTLAIEHEKIERSMAEELGIYLPELTREEELWLKLCDRLEPVLFVRLRHPETFHHWVRSGLCDDIMRTAQTLACRSKVVGLLKPKEWSEADV